ncbi:FtsX-like permease family protein [Betaproteobacteria bacterium MOLA814]|nr:FtsX-like permease family protein [Betaproteobacteria bacterium MOLA814]
MAWHNGSRNWRAGRWRLMVVAVALAVAALTAVGFFADRLQGGLARDAGALLGGDAVVRSDEQPPQAILDLAVASGLATSTSIRFPTMARAPDAFGGEARLVSLKTTDQRYPLRGNLRVADGTTEALLSTDRSVSGGPPVGQAWADASLLESLNITVGDSILLGTTELKMTQVITLESDRGGGFMSFSPRLMINAQDIEATGLVQPASRVNYSFSVAGDADAVRQFTDSVQALIDKSSDGEAPADMAARGLRLDSLEEGRPETTQTLARAEKFLNLVAMLTALLCAVAVAIGARGFAASQLDTCAMLRVLGLSQRTIARSFMVEFYAVGLLAALLGVVLGWGVHWVFVWLLAELVKTELPAASLWPVVTGLGVGLSLMTAFGVAPILQLSKVPPLRVMRRETGDLRPASVWVWAAGLLGFCALLLVVSRDLVMGAAAVGGFAISIVLFAGVSWMALRALRFSVREDTAPRWLILATRQLVARPGLAVVQVSSLAVGLLALALLVLLRTDLIASWRDATPADAPTRFVINIQPDQAQAFQDQLRQAGVTDYDWYPMFRGRLVSINGEAVRSDAYEDPRAQRLVQREFNLSHSAELPLKNVIVDGDWTAGEAGTISVEEGLANDLGLKVGDTMGFDVAGDVVSARISDLRRVDWASMRVNFFALFPVAEMPDMPITYISAFRAPETSAVGPDGIVRSFDNQLVRNFPNVTNINTATTLAQVQRILDQVIRAIEFLFGFSVVAGLVVLFAAITHTRAERAREYAILRAVGARSALLRQVQRAELAGVGLLAGAMASSAAMVLGWVLAKQVFEFNWYPPLWVPVVGALCGAGLALLAGWWGLREVLNTPAWQTLRQRLE